MESIIKFNGVEVEIIPSTQHGLLIVTSNDANNPEECQTYDINLSYSEDLLIDGFKVKDLIAFWIANPHIREELPF